MADSSEARLAEPIDERREQELIDALKRLRDQCRWLAGLGLASILGTVLRSDDFTGGARTAVILVAALVIVLGLLGAVSRYKGQVDEGRYLDTLAGLARNARYLRNACIVLLLLALGLMIAQLVS